jgi:hypothetical protein
MFDEIDNTICNVRGRAVELGQGSVTGLSVSVAAPQLCQGVATGLPRRSGVGGGARLLRQTTGYWRKAFFPS